MEYSVKQLSEIAGVSIRTLHFYDEIGLLKPDRTTPSGYRVYGSAEVDLLQQILLHREMGIPLDEIKKLLTDPGFDREQALTEHLTRLKKKESVWMRSSTM